MCFSIIVNGIILKNNVFLSISHRLCVAASGYNVAFIIDSYFKDLCQYNLSLFDFRLSLNKLIPSVIE